MAMFLLFVVGVIGMTHIIIDSTLLAPVRQFVKDAFPESFSALVDCYLCTGFWAGLFIGWATLIAEPFSPHWDWLPKLFACGCGGAFLSNLAAVLLNYLDAQTIMNLEKNDKDGN